MNIMMIISQTILTSDMKCIDSHLIYNSQSKENQTKPNKTNSRKHMFPYLSIYFYHMDKNSLSPPPDRIHMIPSEKCIKESY